MLPTPSSSVPPSEASNPICEQCGTNTGLERIDATKLNTLLGSLTDGLSRDAHGNFFVEGAKTGKDTRHGQLGDLFSLMSRLEGFKTTMDRYIALHAPKEVVKTEKPVSINQNMKAIVAELVEQQVANRLRDLSIGNERLGDRVAELEKLEWKAKGGKTKDALANVSSNLDKVAKAQGTRDRHHERVSTDLFSDVSNAAIEALESRCAENEKQDNVLLKAVKDLYLWKRTIDHWKIDINAWKTTMETWKAGVEKWIRKTHQAWATGVTDWQKEMEEWRKGMDERDAGSERLGKERTEDCEAPAAERGNAVPASLTERLMSMGFGRG